MALDNSKLPVHVAFIPDGNRRWARERGLPAVEGHRVSFEQGAALAEVIAQRGIKYMTFWALSTENWKRAQDEVGFLMKLLEVGILREARKLQDKGFAIRFFGSKQGMSPKLVAGMAEVERRVVENPRATINFCVNYGGQRDLTEAVRAIVRAGVEAEAVDEPLIASHLSSHGTPPVDLVVRTSGEQRLSNFMLWEVAYAELVFVDCYWPDFDAAQFDLTIAEYSRRQRRFGGS